MKSSASPVVALVLSLALASLLLPACYGSASRHAALDAGTEPGIDSGEEPPTDAVADLPYFGGCINPSDWGEVAPFDVAEDRAVAAFVGDPVRISDPTHHGLIPAVEWSGSEWGVAYMGEPTSVFQRLDSAGVPAGTMEIINPGHESDSLAMDWANGSFGIVLWNHDGEYIYTSILDAAGDLACGPNLIMNAYGPPDIAGYEAYPGWLLAFAVTSPDRSDTFVYVAHVDETGRSTGRAQELGRTMYRYPTKIVGFCDMASAIFWKDERELLQRTFAWPDVEASPGTSRLGSAAELNNDTLAAVAFRDRVVVAWYEAYSGPRTLVFDPLTGSTLHGPTRVDSTEISYGVPGLAPAHERGFVGACYPTGLDSSHEDLVFRLLDGSGEPVGAPLTIVSDRECADACALDWSGSEFLVAYWICGATGADDFGVWTRRVVPLL